MKKFLENVLRFPTFVISSIAGLFLLLISPLVAKAYNNQAFFIGILVVFIATLVLLINKMLGL
uniref:Ycf33 n=1 Tax=Meringosphaera mediterranea TaxID=2837474 RepID=UPI00286C114F|nr:Ycf33 [Meringosphaera mediterranea]WLD05771.1 Ycf33 [Meringosphaera mediterranea]WLD05819.1 Ycf33 [Meringosphaera mediterranea]WLD06039.1 Ycf33 [Meringosphaera mediterranea]